MTPAPSCPDCRYRLACAAGGQLACLADAKRRAEPQRAKWTKEREKMREWNKEAERRGNVANSCTNNN